MDKLKNVLEKKNKRQNKKTANTKTSGKYRDSKAGTATNGQMDDCRRATITTLCGQKSFILQFILTQWWWGVN